MNVSKTKRRWIRWQRYTNHTGTRTANRKLHGQHNGYINAHWDIMIAHRPIGTGIRVPFRFRGSL